MNIEGIPRYSSATNTGVDTFLRLSLQFLNRIPKDELTRSELKSEEMTVFAPNNEAVRAFEARLQAEGKDPQTVWDEIYAYHLCESPLVQYEYRGTFELLILITSFNESPGNATCAAPVFALPLFSRKANGHNKVHMVIVTSGYRSLTAAAGLYQAK